jgi:hypothetical protein
LHLLRFAQERQTLAEDDFAALEALAMQCVSWQLYPQGRHLCNELRAHYLVSENFDRAMVMEQQLNALNEQEAQELFEKAQSDYGAGRYFEVLDHVSELREKFLHFSRMKTVDEIEQLTQVEIAKSLPGNSSIDELLNSNWREAALLAQQELQKSASGRANAAELASLLAEEDDEEAEERTIPGWLRRRQVGLLFSEAQRVCEAQNYKQARALLFGVLGNFADLSVDQQALPLLDELTTLILCDDLETGLTDGRWREPDAPQNAVLRLELKQLFDELF